MEEEAEHPASRHLIARSNEVEVDRGLVLSISAQLVQVD
jgi:hypothetical protein